MREDPSQAIRHSVVRGSTSLQPAPVRRGSLRGVDIKVFEELSTRKSVTLGQKTGLFMKAIVSSQGD